MTVEIQKSVESGAFLRETSPKIKKSVMEVWDKWLGPYFHFLEIKFVNNL
jgi:hypothetical protein